MPCCAAKGSKNSGSKSFKGFGEAPKAPQKQQQRALTFEQDSEDEVQMGPAATAAAQADDSDMSFDLPPAYQMYTDAGYKAQRYVGPISLQRPEGEPFPVLCTTRTVLPGDLLLVSPALGFVTGGFQEVPELEDLHAAMMEDGPTPPQRRVLSVLESLRPDPSTSTSTSASSDQQQPPQQAGTIPSLSTLDPKFWSGRGRDTSAPQFSSQRLMRLLSRLSTMDTSQDPAAMQARHQKPCGYVALWPESSLIGHSCAPSTSQLVVADRLVVHATDELPANTPLTRNMIGAAITTPLSQRQAAVAEALKDMGLPLPPQAAEAAAAAAAAAQAGTEEGESEGGGGGERLLTSCCCRRCRLEASVSQELRDTLEAAYQWYVEEGSETWVRAQQEEDVAILRGLLGDCQAVLSEVERAVQAEPDLDDEEQDWLRASAYDTYDLLVMLDELVNRETADADHLQTCLELIRVHSPGSDSHLMVALKLESLRNARFEAYVEMLKRDRPRAKSGKAVTRSEERRLQALKEAVDLASEFRVEAVVTRYGVITEEAMGQLGEGLEAYVEGLEQLSVMQAQGMTELTREIEVDGVKVQIVDKLEVSDEARVGPAARGGAGVTRVMSQDGMQVMVVDDAAAAEEGVGAEWGAGSGAEDGAWEGGEEEEDGVEGVLGQDGEELDLDLEGLEGLDLDDEQLQAALQAALGDLMAAAADGEQEEGAEEEEYDGDVIDVEVEKKV